MCKSENVPSLAFPISKRHQPTEERARTLLEFLRGTENWGANEGWQVRAIMVLADGQREHYTSYVRDAGGSYRDGVRVERLGVAIYEDVGKIAEKPEGMDRELLRDYVLKPLVELSIVVEATWARAKGNPVLYQGHLKAKSPNSVYRLADGAVTALDAATKAEFVVAAKVLRDQLPEQRLERLRVHQQILKSQGETAHGKLLTACVDTIRMYLPYFVPVFSDVSDGDRISDDHALALKKCGLSLTLEDTYPDAILASRSRKLVIGVEAVTSDGEFDEYRLRRLREWAARQGYSLVAAITAYPDYITLAKRQKVQQNLAFGALVWIAEEPEALFRKELGKTSLRDLLNSDGT